MYKRNFKSPEKKICAFLIINFILAVISCVRNILLHYEKVFPPLFCDHMVYYNKCRMVLERTNAADAATSALTWPWTYILGIVIHGAFFDLATSKLYSCVLYLIIISSTSIVVCNTIATKSKSIKLSVILVFLSSWYYVYLVCAFNQGSLVCLLIILALALIDEYPILTGIIMAFAMAKAQIALPFFVFFFFRKKWKTIFTSMAIVMGAWILYCFLTASTPMEQLGYLLFKRTAAGAGDLSYLRFGMFDFILLFDNSKSFISLILSIVVGLFLLVFLELKVIPLEMKKKYTYLSFWPASICCLLWFYTTKCDYLILTIVALGLMEWWIKSQRSMQDTLFVLCVFGCTIMNPTNILGQLLAKIGIIDYSMAQPLEGRFDTILLLIMLAVLGCMSKKGYFATNDNRQ